MAMTREIGKAGWGWTAFVSVISVIYFFPVLWIILTAFKTRTDALAIPPKLFFTPTFDNFISVFYRASITAGASQETNFPLYFFNSIFIAGTSVLLALIIGTLAAYAFSRHPLKGNDTYLFINHPHAAADRGHHPDLFDVPHHRSRRLLLGHHSSLYRVQHPLLSLAGEELLR